MTTRMKLLSSLALTATMLAAVSSDALAKSGGISGTRSFSAPRTSTVVISKARTTTVSTTTARKQTLSAVSQAKLKKQVVYPCLVAPCPVSKPPVVKHPHPIFVPAVSVVAAPVAVDPPGCVYERRVQRLPGGGLQRVIVKVCPGT